ncbi:nucleotidyltransferase family protein [Thalassotalea sp. LPB0316]|uniref:nucleotidyltransferase family protein n=1 Tax=Thalassotalea sp. LPB0316 TaxID=2769490 RepID=UPI0018686AE2|nr:nucleotidyltransferase family protein [Thalassotalea sp. LPB0316]QOL24663.1 nucleotidyltransferase family protein [Thalassotalea sp. LPB0316]
MPYSALLFAAGASTRFSGLKQLQKVGKTTLVEHCFNALNGSDIDDVRLVLSNQNRHILDTVSIALKQVLVASNANDGLSSSISDAIKQLRQENNTLAKFTLPTTSHVLISLADQISLTTDDFQRLILASKNNPNNIVCASSQIGLSPPVIFPSQFFNALAQLTGDSGAKSVLIDNKQHILPVTINNAACDIDTHEDFAQWQQQQIHFTAAT